MRLSLINVDPENKDPPLGLAYIASYVREYGNFDKNNIIDDKNPIKILEKCKPDIVAMSSYSYNFSKANTLAGEIKNRLGIPIIIGGYHISAMPQHLSCSNFDIAVIGEGEQTILELMQFFEKKYSFKEDNLKQIDGIAFKDGNRIIKTSPRKLIEPLDKIPFPARDLLKMKSHYLTLRKASFEKLGIYAQMMTSRGCPYKCVFCSPTKFWGKVRFNSPDYVVNEIEMLRDVYNVDGILIWDDLFIADKNRFKKIVCLLKERKLNDVEFSVFGRANLIGDDICRTLKEMNVKSIDFGLESGSDRVLKYLKGASVTVENNRSALKLCKKYSIRTLGTFIMGSPEETEEDLEKTMALFDNNDLDEAYIFQLMPLPGTDVWRYAKKEGIVSDDADFDFSLLTPIMGKFNPRFMMSKYLDEDKFDLWFNKFIEVMDKKNRMVDVSSMKLKNIKHMLSYRFLLKILKNRKEFFLYFKNAISKK